MKLVLLQYITDELAEQFAIAPKVGVSNMTRFAGDQIVLRITQEVYGREMKRVDVSYPTDWWEAFKDRWFPAWAKKRWPVRMKEITLKATEFYPTISAPEYKAQIVLSSCELGQW